MAVEDKSFFLGMYRNIFLGRKSENRLYDLYQQGLVKGTVTLGEGNEGAIVGLCSALNRETDICNLMQRDFAGYLAWDTSIFHLFCHYLANEKSPTGGKDGNVHHGIVEKGLLPMISHLGALLPNVVGATYARRQKGIPAIGAAIIGDGGTSTGDFHEALNIASVLKVPVIFFIENNHWAYSTPNQMQFNCKRLSDRAAGYGVEGMSIKATHAVEVYRTVKQIADDIRRNPRPFLLEAVTYRLVGHAAYDTADYVPKDELEKWRKEDPIIGMRRYLLENGLYSEDELSEIEAQWETYLSEEANKAIGQKSINPETADWGTYVTTAPSGGNNLPPVSFNNLTAVQAVNAAIRHAMTHDPEVLIIGEDIGVFGGPFKATKGLFEQFGRERVIDMPLSESGFTGFGIGCAEAGMRPIVEMQFSDFATDAVTQIGVNAGSFYFRTGVKLPITIRMPGGGGLSYGPMHSEDLEGVFAAFPGLKIVYPSNTADFFHMLLASIYDDNPVLFFESKFLYRRIRGDIHFDGRIKNFQRASVYKEGKDLTIIAYGAMFHEALSAVEYIEKEQRVSVEIIDPLILKPLDWETICNSVKKTHKLLVVHEAWKTGGIGAGIIAGVIENNFFDLDAPPLLCTAPDTPVPFAPELESDYRPDRNKIIEKITVLLNF
ncbi:MAG: thiamine pyrophosphate-dependent enzyme [Spirochaetota bacterium]